jgi:two-component system, cell cycle sensor histidine kinase and response regulator CckA
VLTAESGDEALRVSAEHSGETSLLLTDVVMTGLSGRQLADKLIVARRGIKVLFLSGYTEDTVVHHGVLDPGVDFLSKPFSREVLGKKLREILVR